MFRSVVAEFGFRLLTMAAGEESYIDSIKLSLWLFGIFKIEFIIKGTCSIFIIGKVNVGLLTIALMH